MTAHSRFRTLIAVVAGALIVPAAVVATTVAPADAGVPKHKHEIYMYKVERTIRLAGVGSDSVADAESQTLGCDPDDYVLDGMWSVKSVDQYNPPVWDPDDDTGFPVPSSHGGEYNDVRDVWVKASYAVPGNFYQWHFELRDKAYGDAQVKLFLTCVRGKVEKTNGHQHALSIRDLFGGSVATTAHPTWPAQRFYWDSYAQNYDGSPSTGAQGRCGANEVFVAPGFDTGSFDHRLIGSYPSLGGVGRSWSWEFANSYDSTSSTWSSTPSSINVYGRCLDRRVFDGPTPRHAIAMKHLPNVDFNFWQEKFIPQGDPREVQYSCDQDNGQFHGYKAMVGWFWLGDYWYDNWYLGMEPRPKTRAYSFWNWNASNAQVKFGALCINSRTSNPIAS